jgi:hypothetical protein
MVRRKLTPEVTVGHFSHQLILILRQGLHLSFSSRPQQKGEGVSPNKKSLILVVEVGLS